MHDSLMDAVRYRHPLDEDIAKVTYKGGGLFGGPGKVVTTTEPVFDPTILPMRSSRDEPKREPRMVAVPHGRSMVLPVTTPDGYGTIEYSIERQEFHFRMPIHMFVSTKHPGTADEINELMMRQWSKGGPLSERIIRLGHVIKAIENGMVQMEDEDG